MPLATAGAIGTVGSVGVLIGSLQSGSPFRVARPGAWFFGPTGGPGRSGGDSRLLGMLLVYAGIALMLGAWVEVVRTLRRTPGPRRTSLLPIVAGWGLPVLVMPPLFSRDVYSYAAQGEMVSRGINPYTHTPSALGGGTYLDLVDPMWRHAPAPYGPAWERLSGWMAEVSGHDVLATVVGFRCIAVVGVVLIAWGVPVLARSMGRDGDVALALAVLNPAVLLVLLGGAHNDALMLGLLVAGCALARRHHVLAGLVLCALAAEVKVPALIGAACIGWWWGAPARQWARRSARVAAAVLVAAGLMALIGAVSGLGWRWVAGLSNPGVVVSWLDPVTAVGLALGHAASALGAPGHSATLVQGARIAGLGLAAVASVGLILRSERIGDIQALGWSLLLFVALGPVVWPWYETWGFVLLAVVAEGWTLRVLVALSAVACVADVPAAREFGGVDPVLAAVGWALLAGVAGAFVVRRILPSLLFGPVPAVSVAAAPTPTPTPPPR